MAVNIGPRIGIDGEAEYRKQIQGIITETKTLKTEMSALTSSFDKDKKSLKDNAAERKLLTEQINKQKEAISKMQSMLDQAKAKTGENSTATQKWEQAVNKATAELNQMQSALKDLPNNVQLLGEKMQTAGEKIKGVGEGIKGVGTTLTTHITAPIVGAGAAAVKLASDYEENLNKVDVAFGKNAEEVKAWAETATTQFGLSQNAALEATSLFGDMGTSMGLSTDEAAAMSTNLAGLAGDLSSFKNVGIDQAMTALNGVFTGETESLKRLGVVMTETNLEEFAEGIGKNYKEMSQAEKVTLRYEYVLSKTKNAQGDYARTSDGAANSLRTLKASVDNLGVAFGQEILPVITPFIGKLTDMITSFGQLDEKTKQTILTVAGIAAVAGPVLMVIGSIITGIGSVISVVGTVTTALGGVAGAFTAAGGAAGILGTAIAAITSPIGIAIAAIGGIIALGIVLYKNWDTIKAKAGELATAVSDKWTEMKEAASQKWSEIKETVSQKWDEIKQKVTDAGKVMLDDSKKALSDIQAAYVEKGGGISGAAAAIMTAVEGAFTTGYDVLNSLTNGKFGEVCNTFNELTGGLLDKAKEVWEGIKQTVQSGVDKLKQIMNFKWELPKLKLPHFKVSGEFSLRPPSAPHFEVDWYAKAMKNGVILNRPTIFGANGNTFLGGGEAGPEAVVGVESLMNMIQSAVQSAGTTVNNGGITINVMQRDGEDSEAFAHRVADIINADVQRGRAAWA